MPGRGDKHYLLECQRQKTSTHTSTPPPPRTVKQPQAYLDQSKLHGGSVAKPSTCRCLVAAGRCITTRLDSASALHREAAASLLDQSELAWRLRCEVKYVQVPGCSGKRQKRSHTLSLLPPRVVVQPYACAINRSCLLLHPVLRTTPVRQRHSWLHQHYSVLLRRQSSCSTIRVIRQLLH